MSFKGKLAAAFGTAFLLWVCIGVLSYRRMLQDDQDQRLLTHTYIVLAKLDSVKIDLADAKAGQRDYILTGEPSFLATHQAALGRLRDDLQILRDLTADNPVQQRSLDRMDSLAAARLAELRQVNSVDSMGADSMKPSVAQIRALLGDMGAEEQRLLVQRSDAARASSRKVKLLIVAGNVLALLILCWAGLAIYREMAKRRRAEETLRQSEERFRLLVSSVQDYAILMLDPEGRVASWNAGAERIEGYAAEEIIGQHFSRFYLPEDIEGGKPKRELQIAAEQGKVEDEGWRVRKDGSRFWADVVITAVRDDSGRLRGFSKVARDLTERKRAEQQTRLQNALLEASNKELEAFSYAVSHDLRAPLRSIDGFSQALLEDCAPRLDDLGKDHLQRVRAATQRMAALIDDLLDLARITRAPMRRETVDLTAMAAAIAADLRRAQPGRFVNLSIAPGLKDSGDPNLLRCVLENLLGNSWKFTSKRERASIEFGKIPINGSFAYFVRDNGAGFDPTYAGRLFGPFQRLHASADFPGTGVGLAAVQRAIRRHGGRIWAESAVDKGATFYFTL